MYQSSNSGQKFDPATLTSTMVQNALWQSGKDAQTYDLDVLEGAANSLLFGIIGDSNEEIVAAVELLQNCKRSSHVPCGSLADMSSPSAHGHVPMAGELSGMAGQLHMLAEYGMSNNQSIVNTTAAYSGGARGVSDERTFFPGSNTVSSQSTMGPRSNIADPISGGCLVQNRAYHCRKCNKQFTTSSNRTRHEKTVCSRETVFPCETCGKVLTRDAHKQAHEKRKHQAELE